MTDTLTAERLEELERLARQATPGPWSSRHDDYVGVEQVQDEADCAYIAAANPATVLALIARIRELEYEVEQWRDAAV